MKYIDISLWKNQRFTNFEHSFSCSFRYEETKEELEEFQISSHELEQELETQLEQAEKKVAALTAASQRLQAECENLKVGISMVDGVNILPLGILYTCVILLCLPYLSFSIF